MPSSLNLRLALKKAQTAALKEKLSEAVKKTFTSEDAEKERTGMADEKKRLETKLEKERKDYNKIIKGYSSWVSSQRCKVNLHDSNK
eukprot:gnl/Chilomastix_caulleri/6421.p1 GENE.gnl/Chilomastix_caulleri/6421~~gnl/Chilomastix_caulleri/6421.p1  ORF type:complete len:87 (+),score=7.64 gnl/Chilomastix_caulleri/6421:129-389(+)